MGNLMATDGNGLLEFCKASMRVHEGVGSVDDEMMAGACTGYLFGVMDTHRDIESYTEYQQNYCLPEYTENQQTQIIRVAVKWLEENPSMLHYVAAGLVKFALTSAFPCK